MRRAQPDDLHEDAVPIMVLNVSEPRLQRLFPVTLTEADALSEAEPSKGALVWLDSGALLLLMYGMLSGRGTISSPASGDPFVDVGALLREVPIRTEEIEWVHESARAALAPLVSGPR